MKLHSLKESLVLQSPYKGAYEPPSLNYISVFKRFYGDYASKRKQFHSANIKLDLTAIESGIYFLSIESEDTNFQTRKVIVR